MSDRYPIFVDRFDAQYPSDLAVCERCHQEMTWNPEEGDPYDLCIRHRVPRTPGGTDFCDGQIVFKYVEGARCPGCGKQDYSMPDGLDGCCSRRCQLQAEYAAQLAARPDPSLNKSDRRKAGR